MLQRFSSPARPIGRCVVLLMALVWPAFGVAQEATRVLPPNPLPRPSVDQTVLPPNPIARPNLATLTTATPQSNASPCVDALRAAGAVFEIRGRHEGEGQCGIDDAVAVSSINGVVLQPEALLSCPAALTFANFWTGTMAPDARTIFGSQPNRVFVAASYACRGRNNVAGARLSEHGFGRAIDIRALSFADGQTWTVAPHPDEADDPAARFQARVREASCGPFTTVLGPGSDGFHQDHIHFDIAPRSSTYCR